MPAPPFGRMPCFHRLRQRGLLLAASCFLAATLTSFTRAAEAIPLRYTLRFSHAHNHYLDVELLAPANDNGVAELMMAVWTPGSYLVREYARHVEDIRASDEAGNELQIRKKGKNRWLIKAQPQAIVRINYRLYCHEMTVRTNWVGDKFAILNGAPTFLTLANSMDQPHQVKIELPANWKNAITPLSQVSDGEPHHYQATNFDELVDSPILCGNPDTYQFTVGDRQHVLVNQGEGGYWNGAEASRDVAKIVAEQQRFWGIAPYERYIFFNLITEARGGLEHDNSTLIMTSRWNFRPRESYLRWLGLVSHEFFHTWNVRRLRPAPLVNYDYESENFTESLWAAEGITSYYQNLCLIRGGVCSKKEFFGLLSKDVEALQSTPGRAAQSLRDSSHDTWIKFYRPDENSANSRISYYTKGAVVAFLLDAKIRQETKGKKSLDDVMRMLYQRHAGDIGYKPEDVRAIAKEVAGIELENWFRSYIDSAVELDYKPALDWFGLEFEREDDNDDNNDTDEEELGETPKPWLGIVTGNSDGRLIVSKVLRDSPAFFAGVSPGDEIVALGNYRVGPDTWESRHEQYRPGDDEELLVSRRDELTRLPVVFGAEPRKNWKLIELEAATDQQKQHLSEWLRAADSVE